MTTSPSSPSPDSTLPTAQENGGTDLPLVAGQWGSGGHKEPPQRLEWGLPARENQKAAAGESVRITVEAASAPSYASFMLHSRIDDSGIPDEDARRQKILACGDGIDDAGCRITDNKDGSYTIESVRAQPTSHPYRVLYVQWAPTRPGDEETWGSWQLPTG
ncbi:hypothetical protein [Streptomyces prasinus]|uniref:hypothetical protein n=1 Tax=Streptomyces prasinus TaxID=67345 RepID=UPI0033C2246A